MTGSNGCRLAIGLMSGTSADGIDAALVKIRGGYRELDLSIELVGFHSCQFSPEEQESILRLCDPQQTSVEDVCWWDYHLGKRFATAAQELLARCGVAPEQITVIGSHGQTVFHIPGQASLQLGQGAVIAAETGIVTVSDFRAADIAVGGQGAPLVPFMDRIVFGRLGRTFAVQNIGGIGNVTVVGPGADKVPAVAFDTGPGNMIIDGVVKRVSQGRQNFDRDGQLAAAGRVSAVLLEKMMSHPYLAATPPKSTGREVFGDSYVEEIWQAAQGLSLAGEDVVATVTAFTARSIADQYQRFIFPYCHLEGVIVGGGGTNNPVLLSQIAESCRLPVYRHEDFGISSAAKEAIAFALLGEACLAGVPSNIPQATGAKRAVILGSVAWPNGKRGPNSDVF